MKLYITATFKGYENRDDVERLCQLIRTAGFEDFCFIRDVEHYQKVFTSPEALMTSSKEAIASCDALLIDYDGPATGRMIELGIAYAFKKKIIVIKHPQMMLKDTISGVADKIVDYETQDDLLKSLTQVFKDFNS